MTGPRRSGAKTRLGTAGAPAHWQAAESTAASLTINAAELLRQPGTRRHVSAMVEAGDLGADHETITGDIEVDLDLESTVDDIALSGTIRVPWRSICRRCLTPLSDTIAIEVHERYAEAPLPDDAFPIERGQLHLRPMVREEVLLEVEGAPLCRPDCPGLCPICGRDLGADTCECDARVVDERWSALDQLRER